MQDKAIAAIGEWQLQKNEGLEPVDLYIENMFPGKDYQMLLLVFEIKKEGGDLHCEYKGIDIEKVRADKDDYRKYAYRNGTSARAGDVTISTRLSVKKLKNIKELQFNKILNQENFEKETLLFKRIQEQFSINYKIIENQIEDYLSNLPKGVNSGISLKINDKKEKYLRNFEIIKNIISKDFHKSKIESNGTISETTKKECSVSKMNQSNIYGFAAPFPYSSPDKKGFVSGFFNKNKNWRNYPISQENALKLELGGRYILNNLTGYFYGNEYLIIPSPIVKTENKKLERIIILLKTAFQNEKKVSNETKRRAEEHVLKMIGKEGENYFNVDIAFFKTVQSSMKIKLMLEEILPSRFRKLFIDAPEKVNKNLLFKNAFTIKNEKQDLSFNYQIVKGFFEKDFLDVVQKLFLGKKLSIEYVYKHIIEIIRKNHNASKMSDGWVEPVNWTVKKAIMLISYLQELEIVNYNQNYTYMETEISVKKESRFNLEGFNDFVKTNSNFLDSDIKVGIFAVGVLVRFLYDIQSQSLNTNNPPFESKLKGYKLNPEILMNVYTEALDKIQKYQKNNYVYLELREVINQYFIVNAPELSKMTNNELSFYFVAGLEMGKRFKREKTEN
jgi:CRISPR-associated protein Csh1